MDRQIGTSVAALWRSRKWWLPLVLVVVLVAGAMATIESLREPPDYLRVGTEDLAAGRYEQAVDCLRRAVAQAVPSDSRALADIHSKLAGAYAAMGQLDQAIEHSTRAIEFQPSAAARYTARGALLVRNGQQERAIADFSRAIELAPLDAQAYAFRGKAYHDARQGARALPDLTRALELDPQPTTYLNRGAALASLERYQDALADLDAAIGLRPDYADAYNNRAVVRFRLGQYDDAWRDVRACRQAGGTPGPGLVQALTAASGQRDTP